MCAEMAVIEAITQRSKSSLARGWRSAALGSEVSAVEEAEIHPTT